MEKIQINQFRMFGAVVLVFDNHPEVVEKYPKLKAAVEKFIGGLTVIEQNRQVQEYRAEGLTINKVKLREDLYRQILRFSKVLMAQATEFGDLKLKTAADYSESDLKRKADSVLFDIGDLFLNEAIAVKAELAKYEVGDAELDNMKRLLGIFKLSIPQKRGSVNISKVSTENIADVFKMMNALLKDEIDMLMGPFEFTLPDFFKTYKNARITVDYKGGGKSTPPEPK